MEEAKEVWDNFQQDQNVKIPHTIWEKWICFINGNLGYFYAALNCLRKKFENERKSKHLSKEEILQYDEREGKNLIFSSVVLEETRKWKTNTPIASMPEVNSTLPIPNKAYGKPLHSF